MTAVNEKIIETVRKHAWEMLSKNSVAMVSRQSLKRIARGEVNQPTIDAMVDRSILMPVYFCEGYDGLIEVDQIDWDRKKFVDPEAGMEMSTSMLFTEWNMNRVGDKPCGIDRPTIRKHDIDTSDRILGERVGAVQIWVRQQLRATAGKTEQMSANGYSSVEICRAEHEAAQEIIEAVRNGVEIEP
jgi:hypothetical protein